MKFNFSTFLKYIILFGILFRLLTLNSRGLWLDEALQFWTSKGANAQSIYLHVIEIETRNIGLAKLINNTHKILLGSPTFTVLLHCWSKISNSVFWIRIIPFLFGIGVLLLMYLVASESYFTKKWALTIVAFCTWNSPWIIYSAELRPYSLEIFCSVLTLFFLIKILKSNGLLTKYYMWLALSILLGVTSGYGYNIYYPFIIIFLICYVICNKRITKSDRFSKIAILVIPIIFSLFYVIEKQNKLINLLLYGFQVHYLPYLSKYLKNGLIFYFQQTARMIVYVISWQLFNVKSIFTFSGASPLRILSVTLTALFLMCSIFTLISCIIKRKNIIEGIIIAVFIYSIAACTILSTMGRVSMAPSRHNLFFSPVLFMSFFICVKQIYNSFKSRLTNIKENFLLIFLLILLLTPNLVSNYQTATRSEMRELLKKIQKTVNRDDKICVFINGSYLSGLPVFKYEYYYSNIPWIKSLRKDDISTDFSFRADINSKYDYQWYIFSDIRLWRNDMAAAVIKNRLSQQFNVIVDTVSLPSSGIFGFRARRQY